MEHSDGDRISRTATKLSDAKDIFQWYLLDCPDLDKLRPRVGPSLVSLEEGKVLMIGGGNPDDGTINEVILINLEPDSKNEHVNVSKHPASECFPPRYEFFCGKDNNQGGNCAWIFGGADAESTTNEIIKIDNDTIIKIDPNENSIEEIPCARTQGNSCALVEHEGKLFIPVFAGGLKGEQPVQDNRLYLFDTTELKWLKVNIKPEEQLANFPSACQPPLVQGHVITAIGSKIFIHGGLDNTTLHDGFHWLDLKARNEDSTFSWIDTDNSNVNISSEKPAARAAHGIARLSDADQSSSEFYIFGGIGQDGDRNDLWSFNVDTNCWTEIFKNEDRRGLYPPPRLDLAMCAVGLLNDSNARETHSVYIIIHGGMGRNGEIFKDTWIMKVQ